MKYKIVLTQQAEIDLRGIYEYIAFILLEPEIAARQLDRIEKSILSLDEIVTVIRVMHGGRDIDKQLKNINK